MCLRLRLSFLASILVLVARLAGHIAATASVHVPVDTDRLRECVAEAMLGKKFRQVADSLFHLYYGDAAVEVFNVLSGHQMKAVEFLAQCVQQEQPDLVEDRLVS